MLVLIVLGSVVELVVSTNTVLNLLNHMISWTTSSTTDPWWIDCLL